MKHFLPLESNPEIFTRLIHKLGADGLEFVDVYSLDEPDLLALIPRPVLALILVFPTSEIYEKFRADDDRTRPSYSGSGKGEDVVWFKQTIHNACGLYAILHALSNGRANQHILPDSPLANLLEQCVPLAPSERCLALETSSELENAHNQAAQEGDSAVPANPEDEVDYHYVCFVQSNSNKRLYELDGRRKGPIDTGIGLADQDDLLSESGCALIKEFIVRESGGNANFSLMALVPA